MAQNTDWVVEPKLSILDRIMSRISELNDQIDTLPGEFPHDVVGVPLSEESWVLRIQEDYLYQIQSLQGFKNILSRDESYLRMLRAAWGNNPATGKPWNVNDIRRKISDDLDRLVWNWGMTRKEAQRASGFVSFYFNTGDPVTIPIGTKVWTDSGIYYQTTQAITNQSPVFNPAVGKYELMVPIMAIEPGVGGNIFIGKIKNASGVSGMVYCRNNTAITGGTDRETDWDLIARAEVAWRGRNLFTRAGLKKYFESKSTVREALVVMPGDALMTRKKAGAIDVYVIAREGSSYSELVSYKGVPFPLENAPLIEAAQAKWWGPGTPPGPGGQLLVEGIDFIISITEGAYRGSILERAVFSFLPGKEIPVGSTIQVTYIGNKAIRDLWKELEVDKFEIAGDILLREGVYRPLTIKWKVKLYPGYESSVDIIHERISQVVSAFFTGSDVYNFTHKGFGASFEASDIVGAVYKFVPEVDYIELPMEWFFIEGQTPGFYDKITLGANEYTRLEKIYFV